MNTQTHNTKIVIDLSTNGLPGIQVITTQQDVADAIDEYQTHKGNSRLFARKTAKMLKQQVRDHISTIQQGQTYHDGFEQMDRQKFDDDLVWIAVYDWIGHGHKIHYQPYHSV